MTLKARVAKLETGRMTQSPVYIAVPVAAGLSPESILVACRAAQGKAGLPVPVDERELIP